MGKPYIPPSESFCKFVFQQLSLRFEQDLVYYNPARVKKQSRSEKAIPGVRLFNISECLVGLEVRLPDDRHRKAKLPQVSLSNDLNYFPSNVEFSPTCRDDLEKVDSSEKLSESLRNYVFTKLSERLENEIKLSTKHHGSRYSLERSRNSVALLKSSSSAILRDEEIEVRPKPKKRRLKTVEVGRPSKEMLSEAAVDSDWVLSGSGAVGWCETKRPKVLHVKLISTLSDGALHCQEIIQ